LFAALSAAAPSPTPFPDYTGDPNLITPGVIGFIAIFLVAVATVFLLIDMNRRIRRSRYREQVRDELAAEDEAAKAEAEAAARRAGRDKPTIL
jgi:hypothetical protein